MSKRVSWLITDQNVTVNYQGQTHIVKRSDVLADKLILAIKENRLDDVPNLVSVAKAMEHQSKGAVEVKDGELLVKGVRVPAELAKKIRSFIDEGLPYQPLVAFAENLQGNPSFRAVNELFQFLEKNDHPLTENGNFIAYKRVRADFKDIHSGTFDNSPGNTVEILRNKVDEDSSRTCSHGLHVANWDYAHTQFSSHNPDTDVMLEVEVNPADVVAIPADYSGSKMRVCRYKVLGVVTTEYTGSSLRVIDPDFSFDEKKKEEEEVDGDYCENCSAYAVVDDHCEECGHNVFDESTYCQECGTEVDEWEDLCEDCQDDDVCNDCGDTCQEEEDKYPYEDELEEEEE